MPPRAVLFDLDGTLVQTREASWKLFAKTNAALGLGIDTQAAFFGLLEDNMFEGLRRHCGVEKADAAAKHFLALLQSEYNPDFVPGMADVVKAFAANFAIAVISSNSVATVRRIMTGQKLSHCFSHVFGGDVEQDKRASVRRFLADGSYLVSRDCVPAYREGEKPDEPAGRQIVLITDTIGDVKHARECGIRAVGVAWGMHSEDRLMAAGAEFVAVWPQELVAYLLPGGFAAASCAVPRPASSSHCAASPDCRCEETELAAAASIRRARRIAAAAELATSTTPAAPEPAPFKPDALLLASLGRLRRRMPGEVTEAMQAN